MGPDAREPSHERAHIMSHVSIASPAIILKRTSTGRGQRFREAASRWGAISSRAQLTAQHMRDICSRLVAVSLDKSLYTAKVRPICSHTPPIANAENCEEIQRGTRQVRNGERR